MYKQRLYVGTLDMILEYNRMGSVRKLRIFNFEGQRQDSYEGTILAKVPNRRVTRVSQKLYSDEKEQR